MRSFASRMHRNSGTITHSLCLRASGGDSDNEEIAPAIKGHVLFHENAILPELSKKLQEGYTFDSMEMTEQKAVKREDFDESGMLLFVWKKNKKLRL